MTDPPHPTAEALTGGEFAVANEPFSLFLAWLEEAKDQEVNDPTAMALATVDAAGMPNVRMVLLKNVGAEGFVFYTNKQSAKGQELRAHPKAALGFHWKSLRRQVRVRGSVSPVSVAEADAYFAGRPRESQVGAWASDQSQPLESRFAFEKRLAAEAARFGDGPVPRPPYWSGYRLVPLEMEFWHDRMFRLHERLVFRRDAEGEVWEKEWLYP